MAERITSRGRVSTADPPEHSSQMVTVQLDTQGRLLRFFAIPRPDRMMAAAHVEPDWRPLFAAAGFDPAAFSETPSPLAPEEDADVRRAWEGVYPDSPDVPIRLEGAAAEGRVFYFRVIEPWMEPTIPRSPPRLAGAMFLVTGFVNSLGLWLAWRNLRLGRGDATGATRVGIVVFGLSVASDLLGSGIALAPGLPTYVGFRLLSWIGNGTTAGLAYLALRVSSS